jgi:phage shock protein A
MNQLQRLWNAVRGKAGSLMDDLEDPDTKLESFVSDLNDHIQDLHRSVAAAVADEKRLKMQIEDHLARAGDWESRAVLALESGDETLAREALLKKEECEAQSIALQKAWETQKDATEKLKASLQAQKLKVSEARTKYTLLLAQYKSAATKQKIQQSLASNGGGDSPMAAIEKLSDKIRRIEAETEVAAELGEDSPAGDLEARFMALERRKKGDDALQLLKAKIGERKQLAGPSDRIDRIEALKAKLEKA